MTTTATPGTTVLPAPCPPDTIRFRTIVGAWEVRGPYFADWSEAEKDAFVQHQQDRQDGPGAARAHERAGVAL